MNITSRTILFFTASLTLITSHLVGQDMAKYRKQIEALSPSDRKMYAESIQKCKAYFQERRVFEGLDALRPAARISPNNPEVKTLFANADIELRSFDAAEKIYAELLEEFPNNLIFTFNLGETFFVRHKWETALKHFTRVTELVYTENKNELFYIAEYKKYIIHIKLGQTEKAAEIADKYSYKSDSPIFYYIQALNHFQKGESSEGNEWILRASRIYLNTPAVLIPFYDALAESGFFKPLNESVTLEAKKKD